MAEIVNLRLARKQKARADKSRLSEQNRAVHGRSKVERERDRKAAQKAESFIEGHRRAAAADADGQ